MEYTQNYKFRLPADSDIIDIGDIDENFINVDALIATLRSDKADKNSPSLQGHQSQLRRLHRTIPRGLPRPRLCRHSYQACKQR